MASAVVLDQDKGGWTRWSVNGETSWQLYNVCLEMTVKEEHGKKRRGRGMNGCSWHLGIL